MKFLQNKILNINPELSALFEENLSLKARFINAN